MTGQFAFPKKGRIRKNREYQYVYRRGKSSAEPMMAMVVAKGRGGPRAGFSAGKKYGNSVERNRAKRLMRESYRHFAKDIKPGTLMVFVARSRIRGAKLDEVKRAMEKLLKRHGCFKEQG